MMFQKYHLAMLSKYAGIGFIAGSVNHGAFSEQRSYLTAGAGILFYLVGAFLDHKNNPDETKDWRALFGFGVMASIGLGFFTGGLQHFIDSPERSVWVVPLGFLMSVFALYFLEGCKRITARDVGIYTVTGMLLVSGASIAGWRFLKHGSAEHHTHTH